MEIKIESTVKGTRILQGSEANLKRRIINEMISICLEKGYNEIMIPIIQFISTFAGKVGGENQKMMYAFKDQGGRDLCLAPEYTANVMQLSQTAFKIQKDVKLFYVAECFRGEKPQAGRLRQFTQFGVEIINPTKDYSAEMVSLAAKLSYICLEQCKSDYKIIIDICATRGLDYYKEGKGFELCIEEFGAQKQICGGGEYTGGTGFAIGIDRLMLANKS